MHPPDKNRVLECSLGRRGAELSATQETLQFLEAPLSTLVQTEHLLRNSDLRMMNARSSNARLHHVTTFPEEELIPTGSRWGR